MSETNSTVIILKFKSSLPVTKLRLLL